jgi:hypothetical protein
MKGVINRRMLVAAGLALVLPLAGVWLQMAAAQTKKGANPKAPAGWGAKPGGTAKMADTMPKMMGGGAGDMMRMMGSLNTPPLDPTIQAEQEALAEQESETQRLLGEYRQTEDEKERGWITGELTKAIAKHFDVRQEARERELKQLEAQVRRLRELHDRRTKEKEQIVQDRVRLLLRDADGLGWGADDDAPSAVRVPNDRLDPALDLTPAIERAP